MKLDLKIFQLKIKKNFEFLFVILMIFISITITQIYNISKNLSQKEYVNLLNNLYFKKTINNIFNNLSPKYKNVEHKIVKNETLNNILKSYEINNKE